MRIHYSFYASKLLHDLGEDGSELRRAVEALLKNPYPEWARKLPDRQNHYEFFSDGFWVVYEVNFGGPETVIKVLVIEE
jgi:hypothetical protein